jgi:hypothetical protein
VFVVDHHDVVHRGVRDLVNAFRDSAADRPDLFLIIGRTGCCVNHINPNIAVTCMGRLPGKPSPDRCGATICSAEFC